MTTHSRPSVLLEGLLISTLLLSLSFSSCNATSRSMETMVVANAMAASCRGGACPTSTMRRDHEDMMHMSSMTSAVAQGKISDPSLLPGHDDSESGVREFVPKNSMDSERLRDSDRVREDGIASDSERMRDTNWGRDSPDNMSDMKRMRDFESDRWTNMHSIRGSDSNKLRHSERMSTNYMEAQRLKNTHTMRDYDRMMGRMGNLDGMRGSQGMIDSDRMRDSRDRMIDSNRMVHSHHMTGSDRMIDSNRMTDSDRISTDFHRMRDSNGMLDSDRMRDSDVMNSEGMRDSHETTNSNTMRDSEINHVIRDSERSADLEIANHSDAEIMQDGDGIMASEGSGDLENAREAQNVMHGSAAQRRAHLDGKMNEEMDRGSEMMRGADHMRNWNNARESSNMMRSSDRMQGGSERISASSHEGMRHSDAADHSRTGSMAMQQSSTAETSFCNGASCRSTSDQMMDDAEQMRDLSNRRGDLEMRDSENMRNVQKGSVQMSTNSHRMRNSDAADHNSRTEHMEVTHDQSSTMEPTSCRGKSCRGTSDPMGDAEQMAMENFHGRGDLETSRDSGVMRYSDNMHGGSKQTSTNSHSPMRNSDAADHSRIRHMQKQHTPTMKPSSCHGSTNCGSTSDAEVMQLSSRHLDGEVIGSRSNKDLKGIASSGLAGMCSRMDATDCQVAQIDGELVRSSKRMNQMAEREVSSNFCRFHGAHCHATLDGELGGSQKMDDHVSEIKGSPTSCRFNGADCHVIPDRETSNPRSTISGKITSCSDEHCRQSMANSEETTAGMTNSERMHRTRNDREIIKSLKWMTSPKANHEEMTDDSQQMRSTDLHVHRHRHSGSMHETEKRSSGIWVSKTAHDLGPEMVHGSTSNHWSANAEINHPSSCSNEADCQRSSGIMHISSRNSKMMEHRDEPDMSNNVSKKSLENRDLTTMDQMNSSGEMRSDNSQMMLNAVETNADSLPMIHGRN